MIRGRGGYLSSRWGMVDGVVKLDLQLQIDPHNKPSEPTQKL